MKSILSKVFLGIGIALLVCYFGGLVYIRYDFYKNTVPSYASYPISVPIIIHSVVFLIPTTLCFIIFLILRVTSKNKPKQ
ncbi:MAG: hypothetical protein K0S47_3955 [Herbinix sp.]|jgi:hypothetical protein|nr:hypothetical protein [Herbinix sp.]